MQENQTGKPTVVTNGRFLVSVGLSKTKSKRVYSDFSGLEELAPGMPDDSTVWKTQSGKSVKKDPITNRWSYVDDKKPSASSHEAIEKEINDFLNSATEDLLKELQGDSGPDSPNISGNTKSEKNHGKYTLSAKDAQDFLDYLDPSKESKEQRNYVSPESIDDVINGLKDKNTLDRVASKGGIDVTRMGGPEKIARARSIIGFYLSRGGRSAVTGERIKFSQLQLDHKVPLSMKGRDTQDNWAYMEPKFNQFKRNLMGENLKAELEKEKNLPEHVREIRKLKQNSLNNVRNTWSSFLEHRDADSVATALTSDHIKKLAKSAKGTEVLKAILNKFEISYYTPTSDGVRTRGLLMSKRTMMAMAVERLELVKTANKIIDGLVDKQLSKSPNEELSKSLDEKLSKSLEDDEYDSQIKRIRSQQKLNKQKQ